MRNTILSISIAFAFFSCNKLETEPKTVVSKTGRIWMDRNLGAEQVATSPNDQKSYGDLYQWGRNTDGHQLRNSISKIGMSNSDSMTNEFFMIPRNTRYENWLEIPNVNLWQGKEKMANINCPCPKGFRLPTASEWKQEVNSWISNDYEGAYNSPLKLPLGGYRYSLSGDLLEVGETGNYWSSSYFGVKSAFLKIERSNTAVSYRYSNGVSYARALIQTRAQGFSVRCIEDNQN